MPKNWCLWTVMLKTLLRVPWTARRSNQSILKEISPEYSLEGLTDAEAPILWPPDAMNWLIIKDPDAGRDWGQEEKGTTEDEMVGWQHQLNGHEYEQALGVGDGQGSLVCCSPWGRSVRFNWAPELNWYYPKPSTDSMQFLSKLTAVFRELEQKNLQFVRKHKRPRIVKASWEKKKKEVEESGSAISNYVTKLQESTVWSWHKNRI